MSADGREDGVAKKSLAENLLSALVVAIAGFVALNLAFLLYFLIFQFFGVFARGNPESMPQWIIFVRYATFLVIIALISWFVFRSKQPLIVKAIIITVPVATAIVLFAMIFNSLPVFAYLAGAVLVGGILFYFYLKKMPWLYYYSVILTTAVLLIFGLTGGEI